MLYRKDESHMSGYAHEWKAAEVEGCRVEWHAQPVAFEPKRIRYKAADGTEHAIDADLVLVAIGQSKLGKMLASLDGIRVEAGRIATDESGFTGRPKWFAGGDCRNGGQEVVNAAAEGKAAARAIHASLGAR
jgi:glutamate synthase (NADPH/NADH) small chain